jgi:hypothetical protein
VGAVGRKLPCSDPRMMRGDEARQACPSLQSAEAFAGVVKRPVPWFQPHGAQDSVGYPHGESRGASQERTRYGYT